MAGPRIETNTKSQTITRPRKCPKNELKVNPIMPREISAFLYDVYKQKCKFDTITLTGKTYVKIDGKSKLTQAIDLLKCKSEIKKAVGKSKMKSEPNLTVHFKREGEILTKAHEKFDISCSRNEEGALKCYGSNSGFAFTFTRTCGVLYLINGHTIAAKQEMPPREQLVYRFLYRTHHKHVEKWQTLLNQ